MKKHIKPNVKRRRFKFLAFALAGFFVIALLSVVSLYVAYLYFDHDLPDLSEITGYQPRLMTEVYSADGRLIGQFAAERRKLISYEEIPTHARNAFIAVEDKRFFEHEGIDFKRIAGALIKNIRKGKIVEGASTITQQVARNLVLSPERSWSRKIKEAILAYRMENNLSKEEILYIYLNHIYFGDGNYGIEAASQNYFGKSAGGINLAEAALLAGLPKAPEAYSPRKHLERAKGRQQLVLEIMEEGGFITRRQKGEAEGYEIKIVPKRNINLEAAPYFVELVRRHLIEKFGTKAFINGGYQVFTTVDVGLNLEAGWALRRGILELESRRGRGVVREHLSTQESVEKFRKSQKVESIEPGKSYQGVITGVEDNKGTFTATVGIAKWEGKFEFAVSSPFGEPVDGFPFPLSEEYAPLNGCRGINLAPSQLNVGDVVGVKVTGEEGGIYQLSLDLAPETQGAILAMDRNGYVKAIAGGFDFADSEFNRALQAQRQPGSSFKPIVYAAAIDKGYTETTIVEDSPIVIKDWIPHNYDGTMLGPISLKEALARSRNLASVRILMDIDPEYAVNYAKRFGFTSHLNPYPSLVLGGSDVRLIEMVRAFNVFASGGRLVEPKFILRIYDREGRLVEDYTTQEYLSKEEAERTEREKKRIEILKQIAEHTDDGYTPKTQDEFIEERDITAEDSPLNDSGEFQGPEEFLEHLRTTKASDFVLPSRAGERVISPETAYIMTDLLQAVVKQGTATRALKLTSLAPVAGKTGTTNDFTDAWFIGFSPKITAGVWIGTDDHEPLGRGEVGGKAALPVWIDFMESALKEFPGGDFGVPDGIQFVSTPYGFVPYKIGSAPGVEDFGIAGDSSEGDGGYGGEDEGEYGSEIDFLLRR